MPEVEALRDSFADDVIVAIATVGVAVIESGIRVVVAVELLS